MGWKGFSRRTAMKRALVTSAYTAPVVLSATVIAPRVSAASPAPASGSGTVTFTSGGTEVVGQGIGFPPDLPFLFLLFDMDGSIRTMAVVNTDRSGAFAVAISPAGYTVGSFPAPGAINGGNIFVKLADTLAGPPIVLSPTPTSTAAPTSIRPPLPTIPPGILTPTVRPQPPRP